ncbi:SHOCT domain-containing protein [Psychromarinibacter halotolerans]|uniref:SHOCT domain-containing protein n=1 Tax=Psychromarinibacter halotolerans TaxID=1775175 RepID=A0ABV7GS17_9RHOB|nr:SHOCT domain-containing protein [Psychromarinibacter halotolerans]MDF0596881.1 SHOCT domain-containing protein [Psychromarinibacter halotolerans]
MTFKLWSMTALANLAASTALAGPDGSWDGHMTWGGGYGVFGGLMMLVFWGVIIALIVLAVHWLRDNSGTGGKRSPDALDILRERLAKGEIDEEEYRRRKAALDE